MNVTIPGDLSSWETVASIQLLQQVVEQDNVTVGVSRLHDISGDTSELLRLAGFNVVDQPPVADWFRFAYSEAYRKIDEADSGYPLILAEQSGLAMLKPVEPRFPFITPYPDGGIVLAPFGLRRELGLPLPVWQAVVTHLRTYRRTVYQVGDRGQRLNFSGFMESEVLEELPVKVRLEALASAKLVVGVPNAWTLAAVGMGVKVLLLYPDHLPPSRWFPFDKDSTTLARISYQAYQLQIPVILTGIRQLIKAL